MMIRRLVLSAVSGLVLLSLGSLVSASGRALSTTLTGAADVNAPGVPNQGDPDGTGSASLTLNEGQGEICFELSVSHITLPATAAHIHVAPVTAPGPVVVPLSPPDASGLSSGCVSADE